MATLANDPLERLAAALGAGASAPRRRMLVIVNPYATTVSDRLKNLVVHALRGTYEVRAVETEARDHATELCREAAREGYDVVVAFGGDGTVNEAANGLAGSTTPLSCLPGGRSNVYCRMLGIPVDVVDATEHLLALADDWRPRAVDLGEVNGRRFLFSAGVGLDASVVEQVDLHPRRKARWGEWYYTLVALRTFNRRYLINPPRLVVELAAERAGGVERAEEVERAAGVERIEGVTAVVQNAQPYTFFGSRPINLAAGASLTSGDLSAVVLIRASPIDLPTIIWRALSGRARLGRHRQVRELSGVRRLEVRSLTEQPLPLQVDGDYIGEVDRAVFRISPERLLVVA